MEDPVYEDYQEWLDHKDLKVFLVQLEHQVRKETVEMEAVEVTLVMSGHVVYKG